MALEIEDTTPSDAKEFRSFSVDFNSARLLTMITRASSYSLRWRGQISLTRYNEEILKELPQAIAPNAPLIDLNNPTPRSLVSASTYCEYSSGLNYRLDKADDRRVFEGILGQTSVEHDTIDFVVAYPRPDTRSVFGYKFEVESPGENSILAVTLDNSVEVKASLVEWLLKHHADPPQTQGLEDHIEIGRALSALRSPQTEAFTGASA